MKEIVVISGKGGTGKTTVTAAFAALAGEAVLVDCDVDAADLHLVVAPEILERHEFYGGKKARIQEDTCSACGECEALCRFDAIRPPADGETTAFRVDPGFCEGCSVCAEFCPEQAVVMEPNLSGEWYRSRTRFGPLVHARLGPAEENSGRLVSLVRREAKSQAADSGASRIIIDGPPGTGCPVIAALTGADFAVLVTEPTVSGLHDLKRVHGLVRHFGIPAAVIINKADLNMMLAAEVEMFAAAEEMEVLGRLPYCTDAVQAQVLGLAVTELPRSELSSRLRRMWSRLEQLTAETRRDFEILTTN